MFILSYICLRQEIGQNKELKNLESLVVTNLQVKKKILSAKYQYSDIKNIIPYICQKI